MARFYLSVIVGLCLLAGVATVFIHSDIDQKTAVTEFDVFESSLEQEQKTFINGDTVDGLESAQRAGNSITEQDLPTVRSDFIPLAEIDFEQLNFSESLHLLSAILLNSDDISEKLKVIALLAAIDDKKAFDVLSIALGSGQEAELRAQAIQAIGERGGDTLFYLGQILMMETDPDLLRLTVDLLELDGSPAALALLTMAQTSLDSAVGRLGTQLLENQQLGDPASGQVIDVGTETGYKQQFISELNALSEEDGITALRDFALLDDESELDALSVVLESDSNPYLKKEVLSILENKDGSDVFDVAAKALGDNNPEIRYQVVRLFEQGGTDTLPYLGQVMFGDTDVELRRLASRIVAEMDSPAARALLESEHF